VLGGTASDGALGLHVVRVDGVVREPAIEQERYGGSVVRSPVLLLVYNRPDFAAKTARVIVDQLPRRLCVASDGPRDRAEATVVAQAQKAVLTAAGDEVEVVRLFRQSNLGCKRAVEQAITWFLEQEPEGSSSRTIAYRIRRSSRSAMRCSERYRDDPKIMHVSGYSPTTSADHGYRCSQFPSVWGWATWARAWSAYDEQLPNAEVIQRPELRSAFATDFEHRFFVDVFARISRGDLDTWDYTWLYAVVSRQALTIRPTRNLVANVGVGDRRAAHTKKPRADVERNSAVGIDVPSLRPPLLSLPDFEDDRNYFRLMLAGRHARKRRLAKALIGRLSAAAHARTPVTRSRLLQPGHRDDVSSKRSSRRMSQRQDPLGEL
jgi:hypothetical protein